MNSPLTVSFLLNQSDDVLYALLRQYMTLHAAIQGGYERYVTSKHHFPVFIHWWHVNLEDMFAKFVIANEKAYRGYCKFALGLLGNNEALTPDYTVSYDEMEFIGYSFIHTNRSTMNFPLSKELCMHHNHMRYSISRVIDEHCLPLSSCLVDCLNLKSLEDYPPNQDAVEVKLKKVFSEQGKYQFA